MCHNCYDRTEGTKAQRTEVELNQRFIEGRTTAVRNKQEVDRQGWNIGRQGYQQLGRQMSTQGGWQAGTGLVILGQGEHRDHEQDKTCSI